MHGNLLEQMANLCNRLPTVGPLSSLRFFPVLGYAKVCMCPFLFTSHTVSLGLTPRSGMVHVFKILCSRCQVAFQKDCAAFTRSHPQGVRRSVFLPFASLLSWKGAWRMQRERERERERERGSLVPADLRAASWPVPPSLGQRVVTWLVSWDRDD